MERGCLHINKLCCMLGQVLQIHCLSYPLPNKMRTEYCLVAVVGLFMFFPSTTYIKEAVAEVRFPNSSFIEVNGGVVPLPFASEVKKNGTAKQDDVLRKKLLLKFDLSPSSNNYAPESVMLPLDFEDYIFTLTLTIGSSYAINNFPLYFDTGSSLIWVHCDSEANQQAGMVFFPSDSESYSLVGPTDAFCVSPYIPDFNNNNCRYSILYGDNSQTQTSGVLATEEFTLTSVTVREPDYYFRSTLLVFGCSDNSKTKLNNFQNGILGMGGGQTSLPMQLFPDYDGFWYCISDNGESSVTFGDRDELEMTGGQRTSILTPVIGTKHFLELDDIGIRGQPLEIPKTNFVLKEDGNGGFFMDSGCTYGRLVEAAHLIVNAELAELFEGWAGIQSSQGQFDSCYKARDRSMMPQLSELPSMTYYMSGGAELTIPPENLFKKVKNDAYLCFTPTSHKTKTIVGAYQQFNTRLSYNLAEKVLIFKQEECSRSQ